MTQTLVPCAGTLQRVQEAQRERAGEVHFSRAAWLDTLAGSDEGTAAAERLPSSDLAGCSAGAPRSSLAALLRRGALLGSV